MMKVSVKNDSGKFRDDYRFYKLNPNHPKKLNQNKD